MRGTRPCWAWKLKIWRELRATLGALSRWAAGSYRVVWWLGCWGVRAERAASMRPHDRLFGTFAA